MVSRRQLLIAGGISAFTTMSTLAVPNTQSVGGQSDVPPGGIPSIVEDGVVQFDYPDGTKIRVYDNKVVVSKPGQPDQEKPHFPIDTQSLAMPVVPSDPTLRKWLDAHADDLRTTIRALLGNDRGSNTKYDEYERDLGLTVYRKILVRHKYIRRLTRTE